MVRRESCGPAGFVIPEQIGSNIRILGAIAARYGLNVINQTGDDTMQIDIHTHGIALTDALHDWTERRLRFALSRFGERVRRISVHFSDVNGPRGGIDQRCRIQATLDGLGEVMIEDTQHNPFVAVSRAAERFARNASRRLELRTTRNRTIPRRARARTVVEDTNPAASGF